MAMLHHSHHTEQPGSHPTGATGAPLSGLGVYSLCSAAMLHQRVNEREKYPPLSLCFLWDSSKSGDKGAVYALQVYQDRNVQISCKSKVKQRLAYGGYITNTSNYYTLTEHFMRNTCTLAHSLSNYNNHVAQCITCRCEPAASGNIHINHRNEEYT